MAGHTAAHMVRKPLPLEPWLAAGPATFDYLFQCALRIRNADGQAVITREHLANALATALDRKQIRETTGNRYELARTPAHGIRSASLLDLVQQ